MDIKLMPEKYKEKGIGGGMKKPSKFGLAKKVFSGSGSWLVVSSVLLGLVILGCFGLWGYKINLSKEKESLSQRFQELNSQRDLELEAVFIGLKEKIESFKQILSARVYSLNAFKVLEELTIPQVHYTKFKADVSVSVVGVEVEASGYEAMAKQLAVFEEDPRISRVDVSEINLEKSGWVVSELEITVDPGLLYTK